MKGCNHVPITRRLNFWFSDGDILYGCLLCCDGSRAIAFNVLYIQWDQISY